MSWMTNSYDQWCHRPILVLPITQPKYFPVCVCVCVCVWIFVVPVPGHPPGAMVALHQTVPDCPTCLLVWSYIFILLFICLVFDFYFIVYLFGILFLLYCLFVWYFIFILLRICLVLYFSVLRICLVLYFTLFVICLVFYFYFVGYLFGITFLLYWLFVWPYICMLLFILPQRSASYLISRSQENICLTGRDFGAWHERRLPPTPFSITSIRHCLVKHEALERAWRVLQKRLLAREPRSERSESAATSQRSWFHPFDSNSYIFLFWVELMDKTWSIGRTQLYLSISPHKSGKVM